MGITDLSTLVVSYVMTLALFVAVVVLLPKLVGQWWHLVIRVLLVLLLNVSMLISVGLQLNRDNNWYVSWSSLLTGDDGKQSAQVSGGSVESAAGAGEQIKTAEKPKEAAARPPLPMPGERVQKYTYTGNQSKMKGDVFVLLPRGYKADTTQKYPVLVAMHGIPGHPDGWIKNMKLQQQLDAAVDGRQVAEPIVVIPQLEFPYGNDTECMDDAKLKIATWITKDMQTFALEHFSVSTERSAWATVGYSAGGWCAAMSAMRNPDMFGAGGSLDGYFSPVFAEKQDPKYFGTEWDMVHLMKTNPPKVALYVQTAKKGDFYAQSKDFIDAAKAPASVKSVVFDDAGHRWSVWIKQLPPFFTWLGQNVPAFAPAK